MPKEFGVQSYSYSNPRIYRISKTGKMYRIMSTCIPKLFCRSAAKINFTYWAAFYFLIIELLIYTLSANCIRMQILGILNHFIYKKLNFETARNQWCYFHTMTQVKLSPYRHAPTVQMIEWVVGSSTMSIPLLKDVELK